jgi:hypothetical protein
MALFNNASSSSNAQNFEFLDILTIISFIMQLTNQLNNEREANNNDIMKALDAQNKEFLNTIIDNQQIIIDNQEKIIDGLSLRSG